MVTIEISPTCSERIFVDRRAEVHVNGMNAELRLMICEGQWLFSEVLKYDRNGVDFWAIQVRRLI